MVKQFDQICDVQSDKVNVITTSWYDGTLAKLHHNVNYSAEVGQAPVMIYVHKLFSNDVHKFLIKLISP
jgi:pyruvate/2-oxoglutarate dehydrogenase complex dihydrolipoamide acyltransferase (E2) component